MKGSIMLGLATALCAVVVTVQPAQGARASSWYWTPGACKSELQTHGVAISDGRSFNVQRAFCVGLHNHCWLNGSVRRYKVFIAVMRSYDGVVRSMQFTVTGHNTWSGSRLKIIDQHMSSTAFANGYGNAAWSIARQENASGCYDIHP